MNRASISFCVPIISVGNSSGEESLLVRDSEVLKELLKTRAILY